MVILCAVLKYKIILPMLVIAVIAVTVKLNQKLLRKWKNKPVEEIEKYSLKDKEVQKLSGYFVDQEEQYVSSLGNGYIMNYLVNGSLSRGFAVVSNKRVYFRGSCFSGQGKSLVRTDEERTVDIKDVTGSGFIYQRYLGILLTTLTAGVTLIVSACLSLLPDTSWIFEESVGCVWHFLYGNIVTLGKMRFYGGLSGAVDAAVVATNTALFLTFAISCLLIFADYLKKRKTMFQIQYAGGCIAFDVSFYAKAEIEDFQKQLRRTKDHVADTATVKTVTVNAPTEAPAQTNLPDELRKYAELLKEGLISQEEYDAMKKKLLGL